MLSKNSIKEAIELGPHWSLMPPLQNQLPKFASTSSKTGTGGTKDGEVFLCFFEQKSTTTRHQDDSLLQAGMEFFSPGAFIQLSYGFGQTVSC